MLSFSSFLNKKRENYFVTYSSREWMKEYVFASTFQDGFHREILNWIMNY